MSWCIYKHTNKVNGKVYIGQTCQMPERRWNEGRGYNPDYPFGKAITKYGWDNFTHEIIEEGILTLEEANDREQYYISYFHSYIGDECCNGYNATKGGDNGAHLGKKVLCIETGEVFETAKAAGEKYHIDPHGILGCCHFLPYMNTAARLHWCFEEEYNPELNKELKPYNGGQNKPIYCFELDQSFETIAQAERELRISHTDISECCSKKRISAHGLHFCYEGEQKNFSFKTNERLAVIRCVETQEVYGSATAAGASVDRAASNIIRACNNGGSCGGKHWEYLVKPPESARGGHNKKAVRCKNTNEVFESATEAGKATNTCVSSICACCRGTQKRTRNGYEWEYIEKGKE